MKFKEQFLNNNFQLLVSELVFGVVWNQAFSWRCSISFDLLTSAFLMSHQPAKLISFGTT